jgi:TonB family protein
MKRITLLLILALSLPLTARADDASRRDKAKQLLILIHTDRLLQQMMDAVMNQFTTTTHQLVGNNATTAQLARMDDFQKQLVDLIKSNLSYASLEPDYIKLYADNFSDEELDGILAFYKSPAGQSMIEKLPAITTQSMKLGQTRVTALLPQIRQMVQDFAKNCPGCNSASVAGMAGMGIGQPPPVLANSQSEIEFSGQTPKVPAGAMSRNIVKSMEPIYPPIAKAAHVQGVVIMRAVINTEGRIEKLETVSGPSMLVSAAEDAVKQWVFKPYLLNGKPTEVATTINVNFTLGDSALPATGSIPASAPASDHPQPASGVTRH